MLKGETTMKTDLQIRKDVERELAWDTRTWNLKIDVKVHDGVVSLTGSVGSYADRIAAQNAAYRVTGVLDIANEIMVKSVRPYTDEEIAHGVRQALRWDSTVPDEQITSSVSDGWVTLGGAVNTLSQRSDAERSVEHLHGVRGVFNEIVVETVRSDPEDLRSSIVHALERRADREAERLRIDITNGEVDLYGRVHSWQERKAVVGSIVPLPGVRKINDKLRIDPYF